LTALSRYPLIKSILIIIPFFIALLILVITSRNSEIQNQEISPEESDYETILPTIVPTNTVTNTPKLIFTLWPTYTPIQIPMAAIIANSIIVWDSPDDTSNRRIDTLYFDEKVLITGRNYATSWFQIENSDGNTGWVEADETSLLIYSNPQRLRIAFYRPITGLIKSPTKLGKGDLVIENNSKNDSLVVLQNEREPGVFSSAYVRSSESYTIKGIASGSYQLFVMSGINWDGYRFNANLKIEKFYDSLHYKNVEYWYTSYNIDLAPVSGGNAITIPINENEFPTLTE
jgi:hypothetical protein